MLSIASLLVATHGKSPQTFSSVRIWIMSWLCELASAKSCCSSWTFWAAAAPAVRRDRTCQVNNKQRQTNTNKDKQIFQIQVVYAHTEIYIYIDVYRLVVVTCCHPNLHRSHLTAHLFLESLGLVSSRLMQLTKADEGTWRGLSHHCRSLARPEPRISYGRFLPQKQSTKEW